jgi:hypothetical protein
VHAPDLTKPGSSILNSEKVLNCRPRHVDVDSVFNDEMLIRMRTADQIRILNRSGSGKDLKPNLQLYWRTNRRLYYGRDSAKVEKKIFTNREEGITS